MDWNSTQTVTHTQAKTAGGETRPVDRAQVLVLTQDPELRSFVRKAFYAGELPSTLVSSTAEADACLAQERFGAFLIGIDSPESLEVLSRVHDKFPDLPVVAIGRIAGPELVRDVMRAGAVDFLFGSFSTKKIAARVGSLLERGAIERSEPSEGSAAVVETQVPSPSLEAAPESSGGAVEIICRNPKMRRILEILDTVSPTESTVLIEGESGTGKELISKRIHGLSKRGSKPFVQVNCGALPENLLESQLFGHEKGSFTGAVHRQVGLFEVAHGGTILLDEVGEMSLDMQVKLLRVLQFREFRRVGGSHELKVDVRILAATNKDLKEEVEKGNFRSDLFYRLNVIRLEVPPLRERLEEIPDLVTLFCEKFSKEKGLPSREFTAAAVERLQKYRWTGNIRELENSVERLLLLAKSETVDSSDLDEHLGETTEMSFPSVFAPTLTLDEVKRIHIANVLRENDGNKMKSARILKINVKTLYNLIKSLDIKF